MKQIDDIKALLSSDLTPEQMEKLDMVLNVILNPCASKLTNEELVDKFINAKKLEGCSPVTLKVYRYELKSLMKFADGRKLVDLSGADIRDYLSNTKETRNVSNTTINNKRSYIASFYIFLCDEQIITHNPISQVKRAKVEKINREAYSDTDIEQLRVGCKNSRERALIETLLCTGCRVSELTSIKIKDISLTAKEVVVRGKGNKERVVYFSDTAIFYMKIYLEESGFTEDDYLFGTLKNPSAQMSNRGIELMLKDIASRGNVETRVHPHRFRRTLATNLSKRGMPVEYIKRILGHEKFDTTLLYCNIKDTDVKYNYAKLTM